MNLCDVNVLIYAHREDAERHEDYREWLERELAAERPYAVSDLVLSGVLRVVTNGRVFDPPTPLGDALQFCADIRGRPNAVAVGPGERHWAIFARLCLESGARANLVPDAFLAALAIESGSELISADAGLRRFRGLRIRHPLDD